MEKALALAITSVVPLVEACGAVVILLAVARALVRYLLYFFRRPGIQLSAVRTHLGRSMVMGLEFQVAADILKTALQPQWTDILQLAALIALRTILNYVLERELKLLHTEVPCPD